MTKRATRRIKIEEDGKPQTKAKFLALAGVPEGEQPDMPRFTAANDKQKLALSMLTEGRSIVFLHGSAGTGKSLLAAYHAARLLKQKKIDKIYLARPAVAVGKSAGLLPGTLDEKLAPYFAQTVRHFETFMGKGFTRWALEKKVIEYQAVEYLRGTSFENCVVIFEESQNFTVEEFEMLLTRLGDGATFIFTGDEKQHDLRGTSGLSVTLSMLNRALDEQPEFLSDTDLQIMDDSIGMVEFLPDDVVRSGLTKALVKLYYHGN